LIATTTSAGDGSYSFSNVGPGLYTLQEVHMDEWFQTAPVDPPGTFVVQAISSTNPGGLDFGNFQLITVTGTVYNDMNGDGMRDNGEPPLQGWTVLLFDPAGNIVATTTSAADGSYSFEDLFPGTFTVGEVLQTGWTQTQPVNPNFYQFTTQSGTDQTGLDFGNVFNLMNLTGNVYNDLDGDGTNNGGTEPPLGGWTVTLFDASGNTVATTTSAADGTYSFTDVVRQNYTVVETIMPGWIATQPNAAATYTVAALAFPATSTTT
jgi:hypothetical protein